MKTLGIGYSLFIIFIVLCSCTTIDRIPEYTHARMIKNIPFYAQEAYQCGPASLAGVLNYWGVHVTPDEIAKEIFSESARGTVTIDMVFYAQKKGLIAGQYRGTIDDLKINIDSGYPLIVLVDFGFCVYKKNHFMVVIGYHENGVIVNSGMKKELFISWKDFLKIWERADYWALIVKSKELRAKSEELR